MATFTTRPLISGRRGVVTAGHYLAAFAGEQIFAAGGNAIDAGVAAGFALALLEPHNNGLGGEVPILVYEAKTRRVHAISGQGIAPAAATIAWFQEQGVRLIPGDGLLPATVPGAVDAWITTLARFGTLSLGQVLAPAIELAEHGWALCRSVSGTIAANERRFREEWPSSAAAYLPERRVPQPGERFRLPEWGATMRRLVDAEREHSHRGRVAALEAARDAFYRGPIAEKIAAFARENAFRDATGRSHRGLLAYEDLAGYRGRVEEPVTFNYRGIDVHKCGPWCQGPVFLQQLALLEGYDLGAMGHNSPDAIHTIVEASKLAFADREFYYGDPLFAKVPLDRLLSKEYAAARRGLIDPQRASLSLRPGDAGPRPRDLLLGGETLAYVGDTTHLDAIDAEGNMIAATPSGGWIPSSPVIPGVGFPLGTRGQMFSLDPEHPNALQPGKRPRTTLTPSLATREGAPWMVFGTPGGDMQDQWTLQFFLNVVDFGMGVQEALDAPSFSSYHFHSSFYPRRAFPGRLEVEGRVPEETRAALRRRGHEVVVTGDWANGRVLAARIDAEQGLLFAGASPRGETGYAVGW